MARADDIINELGVREIMARFRNDGSCEAVIEAALTKLATPSADELLRRINQSALADAARLVVMAQNPANFHYWTKSVGIFTAGEVRAAIAKAEGRSDV